MTESLYSFLGLIIGAGTPISLFLLLVWFFNYLPIPMTPKKNLSQRDLQKLDLETKDRAKEEYLDALKTWEHLDFMTKGGTGGKRSDRIRLVDARMKRDFYHNQATIIGVELVD